MISEIIVYFLLLLSILIQPSKNVKKSRFDRFQTKEILQMLSEKEKCLVEMLSDKFGVSEVTIRNDLDQLGQKNMLIRARGGAH